MSLCFSQTSPNCLQHFKSLNPTRVCSPPRVREACRLQKNTNFLGFTTQAWFLFMTNLWVLWKEHIKEHLFHGAEFDFFHSQATTAITYIDLLQKLFHFLKINQPSKLNERCLYGLVMITESLTGTKLLSASKKHLFMCNGHSQLSMNLCRFRRNRK